MKRLLTKRLLTKRQEQALKLCHHNFSGLTQEAAAKIMHIAQKNVHKLLERAEKVLPQYFPILTKREAKVYNYYMAGWSVWMISEYMGISEMMVYHTLIRAKKKGMYFVNSRGRVLSFDQFKISNADSWDGEVKQRF